MENKDKTKEIVEKFYDRFNENICCFELENKSEDYKEGYIQAIADICGRLDQTAIELGLNLDKYYGRAGGEEKSTSEKIFNEE